jgi:hypothetical protein
LHAPSPASLSRGLVHPESDFSLGKNVFLPREKSPTAWISGKTGQIGT